MRPAHLSKLLVRGGDLDDLALLHCEWALGLDRFAALRASRLAAGVPGDARPLDLLGEHGDHWLFRFSLPIEGGKRTSAVRISAAPGGVLVEHLVVRDGLSLPPESSADSPETTRAILELPGAEPGQLRRVGPMVLVERDVPTFVAHVLDPRRAAPLVLVSVDNTTREPLVEPVELARRLAGMVEVVSLSTVVASRRVKDELMARGFSDKFGCYNGGVRILWPGIQKSDNPYDHLLILPVRLETIAPGARAEQVAGLFCEMIAEDEDLRAWLREVEAPARPEPMRRHAPEPGPVARASGGIVLSEPPPPPPPPTIPWRSPLARRAPPPAQIIAETPAVTAPPAAVAPPAAAPTSAPTATAPLPAVAPTPAPEPPASPPPEPAFAESEPTPLPGFASSQPSPPTAAHESAAPETPEPVEPRPRAARRETPWSRLAGDVVAAAELAEELEDELDETRRELAAARKAQRRAEQERDEAVEARFVTGTVAAALALAEATFPERLVVLSSARASAEASPFREPGRVFQVLALLAFFGRHDGELEAALNRVLGAQVRWRPKDSPATTTTFGAQRTWVDRSGVRKLYRRHLTLGHGVDAQRCAQIYYDVISDGRIELAWIGEHRPTVSEDT